MPKYIFLIKRDGNGSAVVEIYDFLRERCELGELVCFYETTSKGATASARREIKRLERSA